MNEEETVVLPRRPGRRGLLFALIALIVLSFCLGWLLMGIYYRERVIPRIRRMAIPELTVLAAYGDIKAGQELTSHNTVLKRVPSDRIGAGVIIVNTRIRGWEADLDGKEVVAGIKNGDPVLWYQIGPKREAGATRPEARSRHEIEIDGLRARCGGRRPEDETPPALKENECAFGIWAVKEAQPCQAVFLMEQLQPGERLVTRYVNGRCQLDIEFRGP